MTAKPAPFSQGPWHGQKHGRYYMIYNSFGVVAVMQPKSYAEQDERNYALITAAPRLYAALERILRAHDSGNNGAVMGEAVLCQSFASQAREALTQADGADV